MSADWGMAGILSDVPFHPPLRRVSRGPKVMVCPTDKPQRLLMPMTSAPPGGLTPTGAETTANRPLPPALLLPLSSSAHAVCQSPPTTTLANSSKANAQHDSCYNSSGSGSSESDHLNVSREPSGTTTTGSTVDDGCAQKSGISAGHSCTGASASSKGAVEQNETGVVDATSSVAGVVVVDYAKARDFAVRLGYTEAQLTTVLDRLGRDPMPEHDRILAELVRLGAAGGGAKQQAANRATPKHSGPAAHATLANSTSAGVCSSSRGDGVSDGVHKTPPPLRSVVIDGSNLAMTHGQNEVFSCKGIKSCVDFFQARRHTDIKVFVPQFRRENPRADCPITDQQILLDLEACRILVWTPSRQVGGRRIVCHDDRYILKTALEKDAVIVSNDEYRELIRENPIYRKLVEDRLLMYSFVDGKFMPPDDPLGRHGPRLEQFLSRRPMSGCSSTTSCPYGRKCTYGNKCKFFHSDRPGGIHVGVTERLIGDVCRQPLASSASLGYEFGGSGGSAVRLRPLHPTFTAVSTQSPHTSLSGGGVPFYTTQSPAMRKHVGAVRTSSVNLPLKSNPPVVSAAGNGPFGARGFGGSSDLVADWTIYTGMPPPGFDGQYEHGCTPPQSAILDETHYRPDARQNHMFYDYGTRRHHSRLVDECFYPKQAMSDPDIATDWRLPMTDAADLHGLLAVPPGQRAPFNSHLLEHTQLNRNMSAPAPGGSGGGGCRSLASDRAPLPGSSATVRAPGDGRKNSLSDTQLHWPPSVAAAPQAVTSLDAGDVDDAQALCRVSSTDSAFGSDGSSHCSNYFVPSTAVWGASELSVASSLSPAAAVPQPTQAQAVECGQSMTAGDGLRRDKLFYHLSQLFNESVVTAVMNAHPEEQDAQVLCSRILGVRKGFAQGMTPFEGDS